MLRRQEINMVYEALYKSWLLWICGCRIGFRLWSYLCWHLPFLRSLRINILIYSFPNAIFMFILMPVVSVRSSIFENHSSVNSSPLKKNKNIVHLVAWYLFSTLRLFSSLCWATQAFRPKTLLLLVTRCILVSICLFLATSSVSEQTS